MTLSFGSTTSSIKGYKAGSLLTLSPPNPPPTPTISSVQLVSGTTYAVSLSSYPSIANYVRLLVSINGGSQISVATQFAVGETLKNVDIGSSGTPTFYAIAGNSGGESATSAGVAYSSGGGSSGGSNYDQWGIDTYLEQYLTSSVDMIVDDFSGGSGITATWMTDATGGYAHLDVPNGQACGLRWNNPDSTLKQLYVRFGLRRLSNSYNSKQLKIFHSWSGTGQGASTANYTFGPQINAYNNGGNFAGGVSYSDNGTGDNNTSPPYSGAPTPPSTGYGGTFHLTPYPTQQIVTAGVTQAINDWDTWEMAVKKNDDGVNNGLIWVAKNGIPIFYFKDMYNCGPGLQSIAGFHLFGYVPNGVHAQEDYRLCSIAGVLPVGRGL